MKLKTNNITKKLQSSLCSVVENFPPKCELQITKLEYLLLEGKVPFESFTIKFILLR